MSLKSWSESFYPTPADDFRKEGSSKKEATHHSLRKWSGMRKVILEQHGVRLVVPAAGPRPYLEDLAAGALFRISSKNCALCQLCTKSGGVDCLKCPIMLMRGSGCFAEWSIWRLKGDPEPMIQLLHDTLEFVKRKIAEERDPEKGTEMPKTETKFHPLLERAREELRKNSAPWEVVSIEGRVIRISKPNNHENADIVFNSYDGHQINFRKGWWYTPDALTALIEVFKHYDEVIAFKPQPTFEETVRAAFNQLNHYSFTLGLVEEDLVEVIEGGATSERGRLTMRCSGRHWTVEEGRPMLNPNDLEFLRLFFIKLKKIAEEDC